MKRMSCRKRMKKYFSSPLKKAAGIIAAILLLSCIVSTALAEGGMPADGIILDKGTATIPCGGNVTITAAVYPIDAANKNVLWTSGNEGIATVAGGIVTGVAPGTATITATTEDGGFTAQCVVTVTIRGITVSPADIELCPGDTAVLSAASDPAGASISWSSGDESVATVHEGTITANSVGKAVITAVSGDGLFSAICTVNVVSPQIISTVYTIDRENGTISGISKFTSSGQLFANTGCNAADLSVVKPNGSAYTGIAVGTNMTLKLTINGTVRDSLKLVVSGDGDGNGAVTISDYTLTRLDILGINSLNGLYKQACDVNGDGMITITDYTLIRLDILGIKPISDNTPALPAITDSRIKAFIDVALSQRGKPYVWGDEGPDSFDCSGYVYYCLNNSGYSVTRTTADKYSKYTLWQYVPKDQLQPGDLMFFNSDDEPGVIGHVGIYLGNGYLIHASSDYGCIIICPLGGWYTDALAFGRRVFY